MAAVADDMKFLVCEGESGAENQVQPNRRSRAVAFAMVGSAGLLALTLGVSKQGALRSSVSTDGIIEEAATWVSPFVSQCGTMDVDYDSVDNSGWGLGMDHIPNPEVCCALCQGVPECQSFTWVKYALPDGCPSQCWLKGGIGVKTAKTGFVTGTPPARKQFVVPPAPQTGGYGTSTYCFSLMVPGTDEQKLLEFQASQGLSIFACNDHDIFSNQQLMVAGSYTVTVDSDLKCDYGGDSGTALNSWIFIAVFKALLDVGKWAQYDWTVKADPDAVFFPDRLVPILQEHVGAGYINNCKYGMHGPIEVFGKPAMQALSDDYDKSWDGKAPASCVKGLHFNMWGEDMFLNQCLGKILQVGPVPLDERLMCEDHCDCPAWYWCNNGTDRVSYHPFKTVESYSNCVANAMTR